MRPVPGTIAEASHRRKARHGSCGGARRQREQPDVVVSHPFDRNGLGEVASRTISPTRTITTARGSVQFPV